MRKHIFHKYIISFASFFLVPLVVLSICLQAVMYNNLNKEILDFNQNILERLGNDIAVLHGRLMEAGNKISFSSPVTSNNFDSKSQLNLITALRGETGDNLYISKAYLIYQDQDICFSSQGIYSKQLLLAGQLRLPSSEQKLFLEKLYSRKSPSYDRILKQYRQMEGIALRPQIIFIYPVSNYSDHLGAWLVFELQDSRLNLELAASAGKYSKGVTLWNQEGEELTKKGSSFFGASLPDEILLLPPGQFSMPDTKDRNSKVLIYPLGGSGLILADWIYMPNLLEAVFQNHSPLIAGVLVFLMAGCVLAIYAAYYYYKPIRQLALYMRKEESPLDSSKDELDYMKGQYDTVVSIRESLAEEIKSQWPLVEERLVTKLLYDGSCGLSEDDIVERVFKKRTGGPHFVAIMVKKSRSDPPFASEYNKRKEELFSLLSNRYMVNSVYLYDYKAVAIVIGALSLPEDSKQEVKALLEQVLPKEDYLVCIGNVYTDAAGIHVSFLEALTGVKYQLLNPHQEYPFGGSNQQGGEDYSRKINLYQTECLLAINRCLDLSDPDRVEQCMNEVVLNLEELPGQMAMMCCYDIVSQLIKEIRKRKIIMMESELFLLTSFSTLEDFGAKLIRVLVRTCKDIRSFQINDLNMQVRKILDYLDERYKDPALSLSAMSEHFGYSSSHMSKLISQNLEKSFSELVSERRLAYIKTCLINTNKQIAQIAQEAGYLNLSNFARRFKAAEHTTPGQYRSLYGKITTETPTEPDAGQRDGLL